MKSITFSIPAYNEDKSILLLINEIEVVAKSLNLKYTILIIDDGSSDNTPLILKQLIQSNEKIKVVTHQKNLGFGKTIKEVFQLPTTEWIFFLSGDNQFPATNLYKMIKHIDKHNFILGKRINRNDNIYRKFNSYIYNILISLIAKKRVYDVNSIVLTKTELVKNLNLKANSAFIHAEFFLKASQKSANIIEVPIEHNSRNYGRASGGKFKTVFLTFLEAIKFSLIKQ